MKFIDSVESIQGMLKVMKADSRGTVTVSSIASIALDLHAVQEEAKEEGMDSTAIILYDLRSAVAEATKYSDSIVPTEVKEAIVDGLLQIRQEFCNEAYRYYSENHFEDTDDTRDSFITVCLYRTIE